MNDNDGRAQLPADDNRPQTPYESMTPDTGTPMGVEPNDPTGQGDRGGWASGCDQAGQTEPTNQSWQCGQERYGSAGAYGQCGQYGQSGQYGQPNAAAPYAQAGHYGQYGQYSQYGQGQSGQSAQAPQAAPPAGQYPPQGAYPYGYGYPMPTYERWNVLCIVGFVLAFVIPPVGVILSVIALVQINRTRERSRGLSIAGIVVGGVLTALWIVGIMFVGWAIDTAIRYSDDQGSSYSYSYDYNDADCPVEIDGECYGLDDLEREWGDFDWDNLGVGGLDASKWVGDTPNGAFGTDFDVDFGGETVSEPALDVRGAVAADLLG